MDARATPFITRIGRAVAVLHDAIEGVACEGGDVRTAYQTVMSVNAEWQARPVTPVDHLQLCLDVGADVRVVHAAWFDTVPAQGTWAPPPMLVTVDEFDAERHVAAVRAAAVFAHLHRADVSGADMRVGDQWVVMRW